MALFFELNHKKTALSYTLMARFFSFLAQKTALKYPLMAQKIPLKKYNILIINILHIFYVKSRENTEKKPIFRAFTTTSYETGHLP